MCVSFWRLGVVAHACNSSMCQRIVPWAVCQILGNLGKGDSVLKKNQTKSHLQWDMLAKGHSWL